MGQFLELSISLLKNFNKGNNSNLCNPGGPLAHSALSSLPTRKSKLELRKDFPFPFGIEFYHMQTSASQMSLYS